MNVTIARDLQGKPKGFAHVEFSNELEAQNALSLSGELNSLIHSHVKARGEMSNSPCNLRIPRQLDDVVKRYASVWSEDGWCIAGSILLNQVITVMPKVNIPPAHFALPGYTPAARGRGRGRASFGSPGRGAFRGGYPRPFTTRVPFPGRGRGRQTPMGSNKYVRPELKAQPAPKANGTADAAASEEAPQSANGVAAPAPVSAEEAAAVAPSKDTAAGSQPAV